MTPELQLQLVQTDEEESPPDPWLREMLQDYEELDRKCDLILKKIRQRKQQ